MPAVAYILTIETSTIKFARAAYSSKTNFTTAPITVVGLIDMNINSEGIYEIPKLGSLISTRLGLIELFLMATYEIPKYLATENTSINNILKRNVTRKGLFNEHYWDIARSPVNNLRDGIKTQGGPIDKAYYSTWHFANNPGYGGRNGKRADISSRISPIWTSRHRRRLRRYIIPCSGRFSKSLSGFYKLSKPYSPARTGAYADLLVQIIEDENVDLWVSCSGAASTIEDAYAKEAIEERTSCRCVQFDVATTSMLHEKNTFMRACAERKLPIPDTHEVTSRDQVLRVLSASAILYPGRKYILKPVGMDDVKGGVTLLPLSSYSMTLEHVSRLYISTLTPWILQQFIPGGEEYCTHALVVRGKLKCFIASPSAELLMHYAPLPRNDALWREMRDFTVRFLEHSPNASSMTGHLSFDFMVGPGLSRGKGGGFGRRVYAIECNPRAHTAVVLFAQQGPEMGDMVQAYLSAIEEPQNTSTDTKTVYEQKSAGGESLVTPPTILQPRYWIGHDMVSLVVQPLLRLGVGSIGTELE
ncbi:hypothetical protein CIB48_g913 [Xylaria polymorpha]|nr:hypothetical protein CIB48_g913 [Xylaria polymorpha]